MLDHDKLFAAMISCHRSIFKASSVMSCVLG